VQGKEIVAQLASSRRDMRVNELKSQLAGKVSTETLQTALEQLEKDERIKIDRRGALENALVRLFTANE
jgi:DNA-binding HxlR family transcriptional regulator